MLLVFGVRNAPSTKKVVGSQSRKAISLFLSDLVTFFFQVLR